MSAWPDRFEDRKRGWDCAMCADGRPDDNGFGVRVFAGTCSDAYLQRADVGADAPPGFFARDASEHGRRAEAEVQREAAALRGLLR